MFWKNVPKLLASSHAFLSILCVVGTARLANGAEPAAAVTCVPTGPPVQHDSNLSKEVERVLWWLPEDTESLFISRGNVSFQTGPPATTGPMGTSRFHSAPGVAFEDLAAEECIGPLADLSVLYPYPVRDRLVKQFYGPRTALLFVKALRYDKERTAGTCDIVVFHDNTATHMLEGLATVPALRQDFEGIRVLKVDLNDGRLAPADHRWFASPMPHVFVATTSESLMKVLAGRMKRAAKTRALPPDLPEWQQVDPTAPAWAIRHYRTESADADKTSMLKRDPNAKGLVVFCGNKPSTFVSMRYVSKSEDAGKRFMQMKADWLGMKTIKASLLARMGRVNTDVVEERLRTNVSREEAIQDDMTMTADVTKHSVHMTYLPLLGFP